MNILMDWHINLHLPSQPALDDISSRNTWDFNTSDVSIRSVDEHTQFLLDQATLLQNALAKYKHDFQEIVNQARLVYDSSTTTKEEKWACCFCWCFTCWFFFSRNINMYIYIISFLDTETLQVVEIHIKGKKWIIIYHNVDIINDLGSLLLTQINFSPSMDK